MALHRSAATLAMTPMPACAHGIDADHCGAAVIASFFDNLQLPDTSCINSTQPPRYPVEPPLS